MKNLILIGLLIILIIFIGGCIGPSNGSETPEESTEPPAETTEYEYCSGNHRGTSSNGPCSSDSDCITDGCNGEICRSGSEEGMMSICVYDPPYPKDLGCSCRCSENKCMWAK